MNGKLCCPSTTFAAELTVSLSLHRSLSGIDVKTDMQEALTLGWMMKFGQIDTLWLKSCWCLQICIQRTYFTDAHTFLAWDRLLKWPKWCGWPRLLRLAVLYVNQVLNATVGVDDRLTVICCFFFFRATFEMTTSKWSTGWGRTDMRSYRAPLTYFIWTL